MRVTVIPEDQVITIDGDAITVSFDVDSNIHAIQWYGESGVIEHKVGGAEPFTDPVIVRPYIEIWRAADAARKIAPSLSELKASKNDEINAARATANTSTFTHDDKAFSCDALSRSDIDGVNGYVALYGSLPPAFPGAWKAADNSYYPIADVAAWKAFYASMVATGAANFMHAQTLKAQLAAATTPETVAAIVW